MTIYVYFFGMIIGIDASRANRKQKTGIEWYSYYLIQELKKISLDSGDKFILYTPFKLQGSLAKLPSNWEEKILKWPPRYLWTQIRLAWDMFFHAPDLLFVPAHCLPLFSFVKKVVTVHDLGFKHFPKSYTWFQRIYYYYSYYWSLKMAQKIIVPSEFTKNDILKNFYSLRKKITVIPLGYTVKKSLSDNQINPNLVLNKYKIKKPFFLYVGRLEKKKNVFGLIKAYQELKSSRQQQKTPNLVLVGKYGYGYTEIKKEILISENIQEIGYIPSEDLSILYSSAFALVFPSFYEGFGLPLLEAMANKCPILASNAGSLPEIGKTAALYFNPFKTEDIKNAMLKIIENENFRQNLIKRGIKRVQSFSWQKCAQATKKVLFSN